MEEQKKKQYFGDYFTIGFLASLFGFLLVIFSVSKLLPQFSKPFYIYYIVEVILIGGTLLCVGDIIGKKVKDKKNLIISFIPVIISILYISLRYQRIFIYAPFVLIGVLISGRPVVQKSYKFFGYFVWIILSITAVLLKRKLQQYQSPPLDLTLIISIYGFIPRFLLEIFWKHREKHIGKNLEGG